MISQLSSVVNHNGTILASVQGNKLGMLLMDLIFCSFLTSILIQFAFKVLVWVIGEERPNSNIYSF